MILNEKNLLLYAAKHYYNPRFSDIDEFHEDLKRFKYLKRLVNRYLDDKELSERLILNHLIVIFNVFGIEPSLKILEVKLEGDQWKVVKPFLIFLKFITNEQYTGIDMDKRVVEALRKI
jgi:hypothetical protein